MPLIIKVIFESKDKALKDILIDRVNDDNQSP